MSSTLEIRCPSPSTRVVAGSEVVVHVVISPGPMAFPGTVQATIVGPEGHSVWGNQVAVNANQAWLETAWPATPGVYTITATCYGISGLELCWATEQFTVVAAPAKV